MVFISVRKCGARNTAAANSNLLSTTAPTSSLGTWQDLNLYSGYSFNGQQVNKSVNPNEAFGGQQTPVGASAFDGLLPMPPLPKQALNALPNQSARPRCIRRCYSSPDVVLHDCNPITPKITNSSAPQLLLILRPRLPVRRISSNSRLRSHHLMAVKRRGHASTI
jgi:hypothetical protein